MAVLNKHKTGIPEGAIYIGRGSPWGNPFIIGRDGDRNDVCRKYKEHLWKELREGRVSLKALAGLDSLDLVCFCAPLNCHGHVLEKAAAWAGKLLSDPEKAESFMKKWDLRR